MHFLNEYYVPEPLKRVSDPAVNKTDENNHPRKSPI